LAGPAKAVQIQSPLGTDGITGDLYSPSKSSSGIAVSTVSDAWWTVKVTATASPPASGQGTLTAPVLDLSVNAVSYGDAGAHPMTIILAVGGFGPTSAAWQATLNGDTVSGVGQSVTFNSYYESSSSATSPGLNGLPQETLLTSSSSLAGPTYAGTWFSAPTTLSSPYLLEEVITIQASAAPAAYNLDARLTTVTVPDGGATARLLGVALAGLALLRRKSAGSRFDL